MSLEMSIYLYAAAGALGAEIYGLYGKNHLRELIAYPREELISHIIVRVMGTLIAGVVGIAMGTGNHPLIVIAIGASAHIIVRRLSRHRLQVTSKYEDLYGRIDITQGQVV
jgi:hypothetical protein